MSMRPDPSVAPPMPLDDPVASELDPEEEDEDEEEDGTDARGESLASAARLLSENRTEFSLRWPVIDDCAATAPDFRAAGAALAATAPPPPPPPANRPPSSSPALARAEDDAAAAAAAPPNRSLPAPSSSSPPRAANRSRASDRKSTRLNSSHVEISYAVFCLK